MAHFLRDERLKNLTITEDRLRKIDAVFQNIRPTVPGVNDANASYLYYVIRFDNKGYRVYDIDRLLEHFRQGESIERVICGIDTGEAIRSSRNVGTYVELRLDAKDPNNSLIQVSSDVSGWVDTSFAALRDVVSRFSNWRGLVRNQWSELAIQLVGVFAGFALSVWVASRISPFLEIENSFILAFIFVLLAFSNLWTVLKNHVTQFLELAFPPIRFYRPDRDQLHWLTQAVVGGIVVAIVLFLLNLMLNYLLASLDAVVKTHAAG